MDHHPSTHYYCYNYFPIFIILKKKITFLVLYVCFFCYLVFYAIEFQSWSNIFRFFDNFNIFIWGSHIKIDDQNRKKQIYITKTKMENCFSWSAPLVWSVLSKSFVIIFCIISLNCCRFSFKAGVLYISRINKNKLSFKLQQKMNKNAITI